MMRASRVPITAAVALIAAHGAAHAGGNVPTLQVTASMANPTVVRGVRSATEIDISKLGLRDCDGHVGRTPSAVLTLSAPMKDLALTAEGADSVVVMFGGSGACAVAATAGDVPSIRLADWPAGRIEIYVGGMHRGDTINATLRLEDLGRPVELAWEKDAAQPRLALAAPPADARVLATRTAGDLVENTGYTGCRHAFFHAAPDLVLDVSQPVDGLGLEVRSHESLDIQIVGPLTPDRRNLQATCWNEKDLMTQRHAFPRLEPGTYALFFGSEERRAPVANVILAGDKSTKDPLALAPAVPDTLAVAERDVLLYFPFLTSDALLDSDQLAAGLFAKAPASLFVFARNDLAATKPELVTSSSDGGGATWPGASAPAIDYPRKDEPLLLVGGGWVVTADGLVFHVQPGDLAERPSGPLAFPAAARPAPATFQHHVNVRGGEDDKVGSAWLAAAKKYDDCQFKISAAVVERIQALQREGTDAAARKIEQIQHATAAKVDAACKPAALDKKRLATWDALIKTRDARRSAALTGAKARLGGLFH